MISLHSLILIAWTMFITVDSIMFNLTPNSRKCLREEIHKGVLVVGEYELTDVPGHRTDLQVMDTKGHTLVNREEITTGKFAFTTDDYDVFEICFVSKIPAGHKTQDREATLSLKHGVEAKTYEGLAEAAKLKPLEVELRRLEDLSSAIVNDFGYMRQREEEMRNTNESTTTRVLYFSIFSMCCLLGLATWQVVYLRTFFKAKKLIE